MALVVVSWDGLSWDEMEWDGVGWVGVVWVGLSWVGLSWIGLTGFDVMEWGWLCSPQLICLSLVWLVFDLGFLSVRFNGLLGTLGSHAQSHANLLVVTMVTNQCNIEGDLVVSIDISGSH